MAQDTYKLLHQGQVASSATTLFTVPSGKSYIVKHMVVTNPTGTDRTFTLWRNGSTDAFNVLPATTVVTGGSIEWNGTMALGEAETLVAQASAATALTLTIDGDEVTY